MIHSLWRRPWTVPLVLFVLSFALRLGVGLALVATGRYEGEAQYRLIAQGVVEGRGFVTDSIEGLDPARTGIIPRFRSFRPPLYPLLLAGVFYVFGPGDLSVLVFQSAVGGLVSPLIFLIGLSLFDRRIALGAALATAVYPYSLYHDVRPFETPLFEALLGALVLLLVSLGTRPRLTAVAGAGALVGLTVATRSFFLAFPIVIACWLLLGPRLSIKRTAAMVATIVLATGLVLTPWTLRNYRIHGAFVPATTYGGWNFYLGNNELALAAARRGEEVDRSLAQRLNDSRVNLSGLSEVELDRWFYGRGVEFIAAHPREAVTLLAYKVWNLWTPILNPPSPRPLNNLAHALSYGTILLLGLIGIVRSLGEARRYSLLYGLFLYFTVSYSVYLTMSRYRKPLDAYLMLFAAGGVVWLFDRARSRARRK